MPSTLAELALWVTAIAGGVAALGFLGQRIGRGALRAWRAVKEAGRVLRATWDLVSYELNRNGGGSMKDNILDIALAQGRTQRDVAQLRKDIQALTDALHRAADKFNPQERDH